MKGILFKCLLSFSWNSSAKFILFNKNINCYVAKVIYTGELIRKIFQQFKMFIQKPIFSFFFRCLFINILLLLKENLFRIRRFFTEVKQTLLQKNCRPSLSVSEESILINVVTLMYFIHSYTSICIQNLQKPIAQNTQELNENSKSKRS